MGAKEWVDLAGNVAWPVATIGLVLFVGIRFKPAVVALIERFEKIKIGNVEITIRQVEELLEIAKEARLLAAEQVRETQDDERREEGRVSDAESKPGSGVRVDLARRLLEDVNRPSIRDLLIATSPGADTGAASYHSDRETGRVETGDVTHFSNARNAYYFYGSRGRDTDVPNGPDEPGGSDDVDDLGDRPSSLPGKS